MKIVIKYLPRTLLIGLIIWIFKTWFMPGLISAGDLWPYSKLIYGARFIVPYAWDLNTGNGLGGFVGPLLWIYVNFGTPITILGGLLGMSWELIERIWYLFPFLIFSFYFSHKLFSKIFPKNNFSILSAAIFTLNTYILMVVGGGQVGGIGIAYSLVPLILYIFIGLSDTLDKNKGLIYESVIAGVILSLQFLVDIRIAYVTLVAIFVLWIYQIFKNKTNFLRLSFFTFIVPLIVVFLLNSFWIVPTAVSGKNPVQAMGSAYSSLSAVKFFSFSKIEDTISLLHPNWPENIFGKVDFLKPEFLLLPILAFLSLIFVKKDGEKRKFVLFFASIGLIGIFLAKGANDPLGIVYLFLFDHLPGFMLFRDPTKWYILIAVSYSILIPYTIQKIYELLEIKTNLNKFISPMFIIAVILYLLFLIKPAILGELNGTFKSVNTPKEYISLENYLSSQDKFFRTLWLPSTQRFAYYANNHPAIPAQVYFNKQEIKDLISILKSENEGEKLKEASVKYIIIPFDSEGEIFLKDRKYDNGAYLKTINSLKQIKWLKQINSFGRIGVFEISNPKEHFWTNNSLLSLTSKQMSPVEYKVDVKNAIKDDEIIFSENYDNGWTARKINADLFNKKNLIISSSYKNALNSFVLRENGDYSLDVYYYPQITVIISSFVSLISLLILITYIGVYKLKKK